MPRKFRLSTHRKNEFRKRHAALKTEGKRPQEEQPIVSSPESFIVSIPIELVMECVVPTFDVLKQRAKLLNLPQGALVVTFSHVTWP